MVKYGYYYAGGLLAGAGVATWLAGWPYAVPFTILAVFCLNFFRDPERAVPSGPVAVSPADGKVVSIRQDDAGGHRVSIFLNVFDVHVNRTPIAGKLTCVTYKKGEFLVASKEDASTANEQNVFSQIAGLIARRIICYKRPGDVLSAGERVGLIKFGSRVDVFLGPEWTVTVRVGERVAGGSSVIARIRETA
jgi:phosphatidylserine decarboxylase